MEANVLTSFKTSCKTRRPNPGIQLNNRLPSDSRELIQAVHLVKHLKIIVLKK